MTALRAELAAVKAQRKAIAAATRIVEAQLKNSAR
jgi:hypothetical protein